MEIIPPDIIQPAKFINEHIIRVIYLAHPYRGKNKIDRWINYRRVSRAIDKLRVRFPEYEFLSTIISLHPIKVKSEDYALKLANFQILRADELWILTPTLSTGMKTEISIAKLNDIPIKEIWTWINK